MKKGVISSDDLGPADLGDRQRFRLWRDFYVANFGARDFTRAPDRKFRAQFKFAQFGAVGIGAFEGTLNDVARSPHDVRADRKDAYFFLINTGSQLMVQQHHSESNIAPGHAALVTYAEPAEFRGHSENSWFSATVPHQLLRELVSNVDDLLARPLDPNDEALGHLRQYVKILLGPDGVYHDAALTGYVGRSLLELIALSLGAGRDFAETVGMSALRAARAREIVAEIQSGFSDPSLSLARVAAKLRMSERYIQALLTETGSNFTERVMEARLHKARMMLESRAHDRLAIAEIAYACGFNEAPYFNRLFRRRFGASPSDIRQGSRSSAPQQL